MQARAWRSNTRYDSFQSRSISALELLRVSVAPKTQDVSNDFLSIVHSLANMSFLCRLAS